MQLLNNNRKYHYSYQNYFILIAKLRYFYCYLPNIMNIPRNKIEQAITDNKKIVYTHYSRIIKEEPNRSLFFSK